MKVSRRVSILLLAALAVLMASILLFLYLKSRSDQTVTYTESRDLIRQIKQQDSLWENEILKARVAITHNYDPLVSPLGEMTRLWQKFDSMEAQNQRNDSPLWRNAHDGYLNAIKEKTRLVEQFKSHNSVLRNSWPSCRPPRTISSKSSPNCTTRTNCNCRTSPPIPTTCCSAAWSSPRSPPTTGPRISWWA